MKTEESDTRHQMTPKDALHLLRRAGCPPGCHHTCSRRMRRGIAVRYNERHRNPADIELVIAGALLHDIGLHAAATGGRIEKLTAEQDKYLHSWTMGT